MTDKLFKKIATAYYGDGNAIDPAIIALIMAIIQGLIQSCPVMGVKMAMMFPVMSGANRRIKNYVAAFAMNTGEEFDQAKVCECIKKLGASATVEDIQDVKAMEL